MCTLSFRVYRVTCASAAGEILTGSTNDSTVVVFSSGVKDNTEYVCAVSMELGGAVSSMGQPVLLTTREASC